MGKRCGWGLLNQNLTSAFTWSGLFAFSSQARILETDLWQPWCNIYKWSLEIIL